MSEVLLSGFSQLDGQDRAAVVQHAMDKSNWARATKQFSPDPPSGAKPATSPFKATAYSEPGSSVHAASRTNCQGALEKQGFLVPTPGMDICAVGTLAGKRFCLTGLFPELGGGVGLSLGKGRARALIESFGGRVTTCVSRITDVVLVGQEPGSSKLSKARQFGTQLMSLRQLQQGLLSGAETVEEFPDDGMPLVLGPLSTGYRFNGLGRINGPEHKQGPKAKKSVPMSPPAATDTKTKNSSATSVEVIELLDNSSTDEEGAKLTPAVMAVSRSKKRKNSSSSATSVKRLLSSTENASTEVRDRTRSRPTQEIAMPCPSQDGCTVGVFVGARFAITGAFPELRGGRGRYLGVLESSL